MDASVNTGIFNGRNMHGSRHTYNKVKQKQSAESGRVGCTALWVGSHIACLWVWRGHVCNL